MSFHGIGMINMSLCRIDILTSGSSQSEGGFLVKFGSS